MEKQEKRFRLVRFAFESKHKDIVYHYLITDNKIPVLEPNQWILAKSIRSVGTGKEYGKKLVVYLNFLDSIGIEYTDATNRHVRSFVNYILYGSADIIKLPTLETDVVYGTANMYITVVTEFYKWLDDNYETNMLFHSKEDSLRARKSFLYGQIYSYDYRYIIERCVSSQRCRKEYIKWYTKEEKDLLCSGFETLRDEAIFRVTLEGFRIDEVLSMKLEHYNSAEQVIQPSRSKGKTDAKSGFENHLRTVALLESLCVLLDRYIQTERMTAETESGIISEYLFINIKGGQAQGMPVKYSNYYKILKRCADKVGIDSTKIRTHSGRSTKVMEFIEHQVCHPEDGITDAIIMESFGWRSADTIIHYRDHNNQVVAKAVMEKLHRKKDNADG